MAKREKHNIGIILLAVPVSIILIACIFVVISSKFKRVDYCDIIGRSRANAKRFKIY